MQQKNKYTAADLERYHSGRMSEAEMHAIEKEALQDPFLADALEGYIYASTPVKDIDELKEKLFAKKKKRNVFLVMQKQNVWLRIAAMFILIAGIGYLAYQLNFKKENQELAKKEDRQEIKSETKQKSISKSDSINDEKQTAIIPPSVKETVINNKIKKTDQSLKLSTDKAIENSTSDIQQQSVMTTPSPQEKLEVVIANEKNLMKGKVVDSLGRPIQYATIKDNNTKTAIVSDSFGRFKMKANDSSLTANITAPGYKTENKILSDKKEQVIVLQRDNKALEEVVVTANGIKKQKKDLGYSTMLQKRVPGVAVNNSTILSSDLQKFNEYVKDNIKIPADAEGKNYKGKVVLSFEINKRGNPKKIKIEQSLCESCDEEATRLLQHGPKWKFVNNERQKVTIEF